MARPASDNTTAVWKFLRGKGFTPAQTAGIIGGLKGESGAGPEPERPQPLERRHRHRPVARRTRARRPPRRPARPASASLVRAAGTGARRASARQAGAHHRGSGRCVGARLRAAERRRDRIVDRQPQVDGARDLQPPQRRARLSLNSGGGGSSGGSGGSTRTTTTTTPGVDNSLARLALVQSFLGNKNADVLDFAAQAKGLADVPGTTSTQTERLPGSSSGGGSGVGVVLHAADAVGCRELRRQEGRRVDQAGSRLRSQPRLEGAGQLRLPVFRRPDPHLQLGRPAGGEAGHVQPRGHRLPRGAVDVSDAQTLARILARSPYGKRLKWAAFQARLAQQEQPKEAA
jgi:hypothetical protein